LESYNQLMAFLIGICILLAVTVLVLSIVTLIKPTKKIKIEKQECVFCDSESHHSLDCNDMNKFPKSRIPKKTKHNKEEIERCSFCGGEGHSIGGCPVFLSCMG